MMLQPLNLLTKVFFCLLLLLDISITPLLQTTSMLHSFMTGLDLSKPSNPDFIAMAALRNCRAEFSYVLLNLFSLNVQKSCLLENLMYDSLTGESHV